MRQRNVVLSVGQAPYALTDLPTFVDWNVHGIEHGPIAPCRLPDNQANSKGERQRSVAGIAWYDYEEPFHPALQHRKQH